MINAGKSFNVKPFTRFEDISSRTSQSVQQIVIILSGNKLQIEFIGNDSLKENSGITIFNFTDNIIQLYPKQIYKKENFQIPNGYIEVGTLNGAAIYAGSYYQWYQDTSESPLVKSYIFTIDENGKIYGKQWMKDDGVIFELNGNILSYKFTRDGITTKYNFIMEAARAINDGMYNDDIQYFEELKKSDLLTTYTGTYSGNGITLTVDEANAVISTISVPENSDAILNGNTLIIYDDSSNVKEHKIVFNDNKTKATYTKPEGTTVELNKQ